MSLEKLYMEHFKLLKRYEELNDMINRWQSIEIKYAEEYDYINQIIKQLKNELNIIIEKLVLEYWKNNMETIIEELNKNARMAE